MFIRRLLFAQRFFAPENDEGAGAPADDPNVDDALDDLDDLDDLGLDDDPVLPDDDFEPAPEPAPKPASRSSRAIAETRRRAQEAERRAEEAERRAAEVERRFNERQQLEYQATEQQRLAAMEPWERDNYIRDQNLRQTQAQLNQVRFETWDAKDEAKFERLANRNPQLDKIRDEVEERFKQGVKEGKPVDRETIAKFLLGERLLKKAPTQARKTERQAAQNRQAQAVRPGAARGDAGGGRGAGPRQGKTAAERLDGVNI